MLIHGFPISAKLPEDLGAGERFWYWRGVSGRNYIHSIYPADACPPLPGAVYMAVRVRNGERQPIEAGRFPSSWDGNSDGFSSEWVDTDGIDELHVHLLSRDESAADAALKDLWEALNGSEQTIPLAPGFQDVVQAGVAFA